MKAGTLSAIVVRMLLSFVYFRRAAAVTPACPKTCFCNSHSRIVYCSRRGLTAIPDAIPGDTLQLNLNANQFRSSTIGRRNFSANTALQHLYMSDCGLENLEIDTFIDLVDLRWLDLSNNRLTVIKDYTFRGLTLDHLFLNGNRQIQLEPGSFEGLITAGLYLHDCSLRRLRVEVLAPLNVTLRNLWVNGNDIERVDRSLSSIFTALQHLRLGSNPLHCGCEAVWLMELYERSGDVFKGASQPSCASPSRLRGQHFDELSLSDFRCQAPVFSNIDITLGDVSGRLKCSATGDPAPTLFWIQPNGRTTKYLPPAAGEVPAAPVSSSTAAAVVALAGAVEDGARRTDGVLRLGRRRSGHGETSSMTGMYICVANNEAGNVTLAVNISWPTLSRFRPLPRPTAHGRPVDERDPLDDGVSPVNVTLAEAGAGSRGDAGGTGRLFSVTEMVCAVVVTHVATLLMVVALIAVFVQRRAARRRRQQQLLPPVHPGAPVIPGTCPDPRLLHGGGGGEPPLHGVGSMYRHNGYQLPGMTGRTTPYANDFLYDSSTMRSGFNYHASNRR